VRNMPGNPCILMGMAWRALSINIAVSIAVAIAAGAFAYPEAHAFIIAVIIGGAVFVGLSLADVYSSHQSGRPEPRHHT